MKYFFALLYMLLAYAAGAQDCGKLVHTDSVVVHEEKDNDNAIEELGNQAIDHYEALLNYRSKLPHRAILVGCEAKIRSPYQHEDNWREPDSFSIQPILDSQQLYLTGWHTTHMGCKLVSFKSYYILKFTDGTSYKYEEPYLTSHEFDDLFILLSGNIRTLNYSGGRKETGKAYGDTILLKKLAGVPLRSIQEFIARDLATFGIPKDGRLFDKFEPMREIILPRADAIKLMQSLQCLVNMHKP